MGEILGRFIMPHAPVLIKEIGRGSEKRGIISLKGIEIITKKISEIDFDTVIIITPHGHSFGKDNSIVIMDCIEGNFNQFGNYDLKYVFEIDREMSESIVIFGEKSGINMDIVNKTSLKNMGFKETLDHGTLVPLHFINDIGLNFKIVNITFGMSSHSDIVKLGKVISNVVREGSKKALIVASGDLSHKASRDSPYGFDSRGLEFDMEFRSRLSKGSLEDITNIDRILLDYSFECGFRSILMMLGTLGKNSFKFVEYSYEHPFGIGYMTGEII